MTGRLTLRATAKVALLLLAGACAPEVTSLGAQLRPDAMVTEDAAAPDADVAADAEAPMPEGIYLEAEAGELSGGFTVGDDPLASNDRFLEPPPDVTADAAPGEARARYTLSIAAAGSYRIWGRIHSPDADHNRFWFQLDDGSWFKWRISVGDIWYWDDFHDNTDYAMPLTFELTAGTHTLTIANGSDATRLDRLYVTAAGDEPPGNDTPCDPPHTIDRGGACLPSCGLLKGTRCGPACEGLTPLPAYDCDVCCQVE